jgi:plasmid stability protein
VIAGYAPDVTFGDIGRHTIPSGADVGIRRHEEGDIECVIRFPRGQERARRRRRRSGYHSDTTEVVVANLLLRDLDDKVLERLKAAAKAHRRSLQAEIHDALAQASVRSLAETRRLSARWLKRLQGQAHSDSVALIREDRDR